MNLQLDVLLSISFLGIAASICPIQIALLTPFALKLSLNQVNVIKPMMFILSFAVPLTTVGVLVSIAGFMIDILLARLTASIVLLLMALIAMRLIKIKIKRFNINMSTNPLVLGLTYGALTIGRFAPFYVSALAILITAKDIAIAIISMVIYSILMVVPSLTMIMLSSPLLRKLKEKGRLMDYIVGLILLLLALYYLVLAVMAI